MTTTVVVYKRRSKF